MSRDHEDEVDDDYLPRRPPLWKRALWQLQRTFPRSWQAQQSASTPTMPLAPYVEDGNAQLRYEDAELAPPESSGGSGGTDRQVPFLWGWYLTADPWAPHKPAGDDQQWMSVLFGTEEEARTTLGHLRHLLRNDDLPIDADDNANLLRMFERRIEIREFRDTDPELPNR